MLLKKVFSGKERISVNFNIKVLSVSEIPSSKTNNNCGGNIYVEWKKGRSSKDQGQTRHCLLKAKDVEFNDLISFGTHVVRDPKSGACEPKPLVFSLKYSPTEDQKAKSLGEVTIDLAEFAKNPSCDEARSFSFLRKKKEVRAMIQLHIEAKWTKVDKKKYDPSAASATTNSDGAEAADGNDTSESELTHLSDSDLGASDMDDEDTDDNVQNPEGTKAPQHAPTKRKSSKRLSGEAAAAATAATGTLPSITETEPSPRKKGSESDKDSDSSGKERSVSRKSSSRDHSKESGKEKEKEKGKSKKKPRPFSADFSGLSLEVPAQSASIVSPAVDNKANRPLASHSSLGALSLSPGVSGRAPVLAKKQRRRSLEPGSEAAAAIQSAMAAQSNATPQTNGTESSSSAASVLAAAAATVSSAAPIDIPLHTERKIQQEVEMAHEEVRSLRKELMAAQQKIRVLEQDRQRLLHSASALQMAQSTPSPELVSLQDKCLKQDTLLKDRDSTIVALRSELARAKAAAIPWFQSRPNLPPVELPRIISKEDEKRLLMVILLILSIISSCSFLFGMGGSSSTENVDFPPPGAEQFL